jgi:Flp pilus assembly protein TadG
MITRLRSRLLADERGSNAAEIVIIAPVVAMLILVLVAAGRTALADNATQSAAFAAARAASLSRDVTTATTNAQDAAQRAMLHAGISCSTLTVNVDASGLNAPIGTTGDVSATVNCDVNLSDISLPGVPGSRTMTSSATSPVDAYRERG